VNGILNASAALPKTKSASVRSVHFVDPAESALAIAIARGDWASAVATQIWYVHDSPNKRIQSQPTVGDKEVARSWR